MRGVAAGQLDRSAYLGGTRTLLAGIPLHYLIAFTIAATFALASLRLPFLHSHFLLCGIFYGLGVWAVMTLAVLPSAPFTPPAPIRGGSGGGDCAHVLHRPSRRGKRSRSGPIRLTRPVITRSDMEDWADPV